MCILKQIGGRSNDKNLAIGTMWINDRSMQRGEFLNIGLSVQLRQLS